MAVHVLEIQHEICNRFYFYWQPQHEGEEAVRELTLVSSASSSESLRTMDWADVTCSGCTAATLPAPLIRNQNSKE